ncbi:MAG: uracil-DNA glycosylase [Chthoniobacterales bacterium]
MSAGVRSVDGFIRLLKHSPARAVFNPWWQVDREHDADPHAPRIRRRNLRAYLRHRIGTAGIAIIGEALGYRGGHFSGIPMTSERMLLGKIESVEPRRIVPGITPRRTSKINQCAAGFSEPTATIVWGTLFDMGIGPEEFVLWNAFPWHSFDPRRGLLSNRMPNKTECTAGLSILKAFIDLFPCKRTVALGKIASGQLKQVHIDAACVRHPASGGARLFRDQMAKLLCSASRPDQ